VIYVETDEWAGLTSVHHRTNFDTKIVVALRELLDSAVPFVKKMQRDRAAELSQSLPNISRDLAAAIEG
jgi:hypothetical protein